LNCILEKLKHFPYDDIGFAKIDNQRQLRKGFPEVIFCQGKSLEQIGCPNGTTFLIRNLFYNTPARLKYMKTIHTELGNVTDIINRLASAVISGRFGPNAQKALSYANIKMLTFDETYDTIQSVIEGYKSNQLKEF